ncbi:hypothetical protein [Halorientalis salina]|uniref:hypothetical protein n=1 Tax=Halorientalis salina TaxID=2932266 RepID=UPI0010ABACCC|nr:hypothetical protein [Halorientalis salina]
MSAESTLPGLSKHIERYLRIWESVGTREFTIDDVRGIQSSQGDNTGREIDDRELRQSLDTLVAYGLLDSFGDERYRLRLRPDDRLDDWLETMAPRVTGLYDAVQSALSEREASDADGETQPETIQFEGTTYLRKPVSPTESVEDVAATLTDSLDTQSDLDSVVLTSPADEAARVQRIADRLSDTETTGNLPTGGFEKVTTEVKGPDPDALEYRLYLTRGDTSGRYQ